MADTSKVIAEFFGDEEGVAREKSAAIRALPADGAAILPQDDPWFAYLFGRAGAPVLAQQTHRQIAQLAHPQPNQRRFAGSSGSSQAGRWRCASLPWRCATRPFWIRKCSVAKA